MTIEENKKLCEIYPFLKIQYFSDLGSDIEYSRTWSDEVAAGWLSAFGEEMWDDLKELLQKENYLNQFVFIHIKENFGVLKFYYESVPIELKENLIAWENKYEAKCMLYCQQCGEPTHYITTNFANYLCETCAHKYMGEIKELTWTNIPKQYYLITENNVLKTKAFLKESPETDIMKKQWKKD